jgi:hypothetical protein
MASIPSFFGLGAAGNPTTGAATVAWPAGHQVGDIGISFVESAANSTPSILTASGFVFGDASTFSATSTFAFAWARATSNAMANMQWQGRSDHQHAKMLVFRGCTRIGTPFTYTKADLAGPSTAVSAPAITTPMNDCYVLNAISRDNDSAPAAFSGGTNADIAGLVEINDSGSTGGNGGGFAQAGGLVAVAKSVAATTATCSTSVSFAGFTFALKPDRDSDFFMFMP